jgi:hypothetical protein
MNYTTQDIANAYRSYCFAIAVSTGLHGSELTAHIRATVRQSYGILFGDTSLRQVDLDECELDRLTLHRIQITDLILGNPQ